MESPCHGRGDGYLEWREYRRSTLGAHGPSESMVEDLWTDGGSATTDWDVGVGGDEDEIEVERKRGFRESRSVNTLNVQATSD